MYRMYGTVSKDIFQSIFCRRISSCAAYSWDCYSGGQLKLPQAEHRGGLSSRHSSLQVIKFPLFFERQKTRFNLLVIVNFHAAESGYGSTTIAYLFLTQGRCGTGAAGDCEHPPGEWVGPGRPPARPLITTAQPPGIFSNSHPCNPISPLLFSCCSVPDP